MRGILPVRYWLVLAALAVASVVFGVIRLRTSPFADLSQEQIRGLISGQRIDPGFSQWIAGYSGGTRSVKEEIRIQFTEAPDSAKRAEALRESPLKLKPEIKGKLSWADDYTLRFVPEKPLDFATVYGIDLQLDHLFPILTERFKTFSFAFQTEVLRVRVKGLGFTEKGELTATVQTSDYVTDKSVEKALSMESLPGSPRWSHNPEGTIHTLLLDDPRTGSEEDAALTLNLNTLGAKGNLKRRFKLPPKGVFTFFGAEETEEPEHSILVHFTYPLDPDQPEAGLVYLKNVATEGTSQSGCDVRIPVPSDLYGDQQIGISAGLRSGTGRIIPTPFTMPIALRPGLPGLRLPGKGYIVPDAGQQAFVAFEARALRQANVEVYRIYPNNVPEFLASQNLDVPMQSFYQRTLGRPVGKLTVNLPEDARPGEYARYRVDISKIIADAPTALHYARFTFRPDQMRYACPDMQGTPKGALTKVSDQEEESDPSFDWPDDGNNYYEDEGGRWTGRYNEYEYDEQGNQIEPKPLPAPCLQNYAYDPPQGMEGGSIQIGTYLLRSNLGLQARVGAGGTVDVVATDIRTAEPLAGVQVQVLSKQHQVLASGRTQGNGVVQLKSGKRPAPLLIVATGKEGSAYLSLSNAAALDYSAFAEQLQGGGVDDGSPLKGFLYTERGTYRPGDTLHVGFILQGADKSPLTAPVVLEVRNSKGTEIYHRAKAETLGQHYRWNVPTEPSAPTGGYSLYVRAGDKSFYKRIGVETIRPNRMAIRMKLSAPAYLSGSEGRAEVEARYLYGSPAAELAVSTRSTASLTSFSPEGYEDFNFRNYNKPEPDLTAVAGLVLDGKTDTDGKATLPFAVPVYPNLAPVKLTLTTQVFEKGGQFSQQFSQMLVHPVASYVGIREAKKPDAGSYALEQPIGLDVVVIDALNARKVGGRRSLTYTLTRLDWIWWYEAVSGENFYNGAATQNRVKSGQIDVVDGAGSLSVSLPKWGRYAVEIFDPQTQHSTSQVIYVGTPDTEETGNDPLQRMKLKASKKTYAPGETAKLLLPQGQVHKGDRVLVSLEAGNRTLSHTWCTVDYASVSVPLPQDAGPNCYAHVTLLRPYAEAGVGKPLRAYGLVELEISAGHGPLTPLLKAPEEGKPGQPVTVEVSEKFGQGMTYVLAMVDEGLLNLTNFKTPDPAPDLNGRRALQVRAYDMFGQVIERGMLSGTTLLAAGGDGYAKMAMEVADREEARNSLIVEAVSRVRGPFTLKPGEKAKHTLEAPAYPGAVRWMVIANTPENGASTEALTRVKADLILEASLPRVVSTGDEIALPLEVESFLKKNATARLEATVVSGPAKLVGGSVKTLSLAPKSGRQKVELRLKAGNQDGLLVLKLKATAGSAVAERGFRLPVRLANRPQRRVTDGVLAQGEKLNWPGLVPDAIPGPLEAELATAPPLGLKDRLRYLLTYPYGCAEQTVSAAVAQLYLPDVLTLNEAGARRASENVQAAIKRLNLYEVGSGMLALWPGMAQEDVAASAYACYFLQEAQTKGYGESAQRKRLERALKRYLSNATHPKNPAERNLHAFVLYCLGNAADEAALNRQAQDPKLPQQGYTLLAGAYLRRYAFAPAKEMLARQAKAIASGPYEGAYASPIRDMAIAAGIDAGLNTNRLSPLLLKLAQEVRKSPYLSTQELGWAFASLAKLPHGKNDGQVSIGTETATLSSQARSVDVSAGKAAPVVQNKGTAPVYVHVSQTYIPAPGKEPVSANGLMLQVQYVDDLNQPIDPKDLKQGQQFTAQMTVTNRSGIFLDNLALSFPIPGGWEINNDRLAQDAAGTEETYQPGVIFEDIRDDRVNRFFMLENGKSIRFRTRLTAAYLGSFAQPGITTEAMYLPQYQANAVGGRVTVR